MKKLLSVLLALLLCLTATLAWGEGAPAGNDAAPAPEASEFAHPGSVGTDGEGDSEEKSTPQATPDAEATPGVETTPDAEVTPSGEGTPEPGASEVPPAEEATPRPECTPHPEETEPSYTFGEGYTLADGSITYGTLEQLFKAPGPKLVFVSAKEPVILPDFSLALLRDVILKPDPEVYEEEKFIVTLASEEGPIREEDIEGAEDALVTLTVAVEEKKEPAPGGDEGISLRVTPRNFTDGAWQCEIPAFLLEGVPEGDSDCGYAVIIYDERIIPLASDEYCPQEEGAYVVRFAVLNDLGDIVAKSGKYVLMLDFTAPEMSVELSAEEDYTMTLSAADVPGGGSAVCSGVSKFSLDGGESWAPLREGESVVHSESRKRVFPAGMIQVCDLAGNISSNAEDVVLDEVPRVSFGGGGGAPSATTAPHASGSGDAAPYDAYELSMPEGPVETLELGGEPIDLGLEIAGDSLPSEGPGRFTAELISWKNEKAAAQAEPRKDTLIVRAEADGGEAPYTCTWRINGAVLRKLYNTDINYLLLQAGDAALSLPTVGFTAGTRYAELKMEGVSTAEFEYEITMRIDPNAPAAQSSWSFAKDCEAAIYVEVAGERYDMIDRSATPEMYPFDVYCGPADLPDYPYGAYPTDEMEG